MAPHSRLRGRRPAKPGLSRPDDRSSPIADLEFGEDARDVVADGVRTEHELLGDVGVAVAVGDHLEYLPLPVGELGELGCGKALAGGGEVVQQARGDRWAEDGLALAYG